MTQALYRKWRSQTFDEVVGQEHVTTTLRNALREGRVAHAYLFAGPRGTGKTSTARILAKALNCTASEEDRPCGECATCRAIAEGRMLDLIEIDAASNNGVDNIRELRDKIGFAPSEGRFKVYIIDEVHMLSSGAFNALLKTLEEPPPHARFMLATTEPHKIPATVISRCQRFDLRRIPVPEIVEHLQTIAAAEGFAAQEEALTMIARSAQGCMRDAISLLDQMLSYGHEQVTLEQVQRSLGTVGGESVAAFINALATGDVGVGLALIGRLAVDGASLPEFTHQVVERLRGVMLVQLTGDAALLTDQPRADVEQMVQQAKQLPQATTLFAIKRLSEAMGELKGGYQPQLPLEMAFIEAVKGAVQPPQIMLAAAPVPQRSTAASTTNGSAPPLSREAVGRGESASPVEQPTERPSESPEETSNGASPEAADALPVPAQDPEALKRLEHGWNRLLKVVQDRCGFQTAGALRSGKRDIAVGSGTVVLALGDHSFALDHLARPDVRDQVASILSEFLGQTIALRCQPGDKAELASTERAAQPESTDDTNALLAYAVSDLGAEVAQENQ